MKGDAVQGLETIVRDVQLFEGMPGEHVARIAGCASNVLYDAGAIMGRAGDPADVFWVVREGEVSVEAHAPTQGALTIATAHAGDVVGFSWLLPPHKLHFDVRALSPLRALMFDGRCLRNKCATDHEFGYELLRRFSTLMADRMESLGLQLLDVYGDQRAHGR